jgi:hypothetical protein
MYEAAEMTELSPENNSKNYLTETEQAQTTA